MLFGSHISYLVFQCLLMALSFSSSHWWTLIQLTSKQPTPLTLQDLWHLYFPNAWIIALMRAFPSTRTFCRTCSSDTFSDWTTTVCPLHSTQNAALLCPPADQWVRSRISLLGFFWLLLAWHVFVHVFWEADGMKGLGVLETWYTKKPQRKIRRETEGQESCKTVM